MNKFKLPELLSPAGSLEAFEAAIDGGADAIYVGGASFNARANAKNFGEEELRRAVRLAHLYGVKVYQTINIMIHDRELDDLLRMAETSAELGVDAFIVSDLGAASAIRARLPEMPLHASTQMSVHSADGARLLSSLGFSRVVPARELSKKNIQSIVDEGMTEVEIFIHGAMCVSHSGQCLFSSLVGGRSGNRGLCAQPCRLPYAQCDKRVGDRYPLSLKDMSLASHVTEIIKSGVASLKIEGRMKSPEYVRGVTKIWRRLLDEGRNATPDEMRELSELFSRGGFTDGYYTESIGRRMLGVRSDEDKQASRESEKFDGISRKLPISMWVAIKDGEPSRLTVSSGEHTATAEGDVPAAAINAPIGRETILKCMSKLGDTCFSLESIDVDLDEGLMMPISRINALRRDAISALEAVLVEQKPIIKAPETTISEPRGEVKRRRVGRFYSAEQISAKARDFFDIILLPLDRYESVADGFVMPPVIFDSESERAVELIKKCVGNGARYAVVTNLGQIKALKEHAPGVKLIADFRFNVANSKTMAFFEDLGFESILLSTELSLPQIRDVKGAKAVVAYGRIPLMTLEKCVIKELYGDNACTVCSQNGALMKDRRGFVFPVVREYPHRNIVLNSLPTQMSDRQKELSASGAYDLHFLFTVESSAEVDRVIDDYKENRAPSGKVRRI